MTNLPTFKHGSVQTCEAILQAIDRFQGQNGRAPTLRELAAASGYARDTVKKYTSVLTRNGTLKRISWIEMTWKKQ